MNAYDLAKAEIGTVEWAKGSNPKVVAYYADAGAPEVKDDAVAWCAAFVGAMIKRAGGKPTGSLAARSYLDWGEAVGREDAREGDVVVFRRGNSTWQGHVAFLVKDNGATLSVLGGNQRDSVSIGSYPAASLLGIRRAKWAKPPQEAPKPVPPVTAPETTQLRPVGLFGVLAAIIAAFFPSKGA